VPPGASVPWEEPPRELTLSSGEVHVWRAALDRAERVRGLLAGKLSEAERARAEQILPPGRRERWVVARSLLRVILGRYLERGPAEVELGVDSIGRPILVSTSSSTPVSFSLSHSGGVALYAVTAGKRVGIDVERIRDDLDTERVAGRVFSPAQQAALQQLSESDRRVAFFTGWTRMEACAKAVGQGIASLVPGLRVAPTAQAQAALVFEPGDGLPGGPWSLWDLAPKPGYAAAVAVEGSGLALRCLDLTKEEKIALRGRFPRPAEA
jgi:4'-phosphopantetheinyl transferase